MAIKQLALEIGFGTSLRRADYTAAACRAVDNALWRNSLNIAQAFGVDGTAMIVDVDIACQAPEEVDLDAIAGRFPYGKVTVTRSFGGLDVPKSDGSGKTVIANAAIRVSFDMVRT